MMKLNPHHTSRTVKTVAAVLGALSLTFVVPSAYALIGPVGHQTNLTSTHATSLQLADEDDENTQAPPPRDYENEDSAEHEHHEEMEQRARDKAHRFGERQEERAEHLQDKLNHERAEHQRHENEEENGED